MKKKISIGSKLYITLMFVFFYLPILVTMFFSFNSSKSLLNILPSFLLINGRYYIYNHQYHNNK